MIISVTGCSTCRRVFISRKKCSPVAHRRGTPSCRDCDSRWSGRAARHRHRAGSGSRREVRGGRLLENLLVVALDGAVALEEMHHRAVMVGGDLHLDMAGERTSRSSSSRSSPKAALASRARRGDGLRHVARRFTTRMPLPPPPAEAFTSSGKPTPAAAATRAASSPVSASKPGTTGTPAATARRFAAIFEPMAATTSAGGPTKAMPAAAQAAGKSGRSDRKP